MGGSRGYESGRLKVRMRAPENRGVRMWARGGVRVWDTATVAFHFTQGADEPGRSVNGKTLLPIVDQEITSITGILTMSSQRKLKECRVDVQATP